MLLEQSPWLEKTKHRHVVQIVERLGDYIAFYGGAIVARHPSNKGETVPAIIEQLLADADRQIEEVLFAAARDGIFVYQRMPALNATGRVVKIGDLVSEASLSAEARSLLSATINAYMTGREGPEISNGTFDKLTKEVIALQEDDVILLVAENIAKSTRHLCLVPSP